MLQDWYSRLLCKGCAANLKISFSAVLSSILVFLKNTEDQGYLNSTYLSRLVPC
jgi:hypothetical protein